LLHLFFKCSTLKVIFASDKKKTMISLIQIKTVYVNKTRTEFITTDNGIGRPQIKMEVWGDSEITSDDLWDYLFEYLEDDEDGDVSTFIDILEDIAVEIIEE